MTYRFDFSFLGEWWPLFLEGVGASLAVSLSAAGIGLFLGTFCAVARVQGPAWLRRAVAFYVEGIRNTPLLVQIFLLFFGLATLGLRIGAMQAAVAALTVNMGAYACEIIRAGIEGAGRGQMEAARALGLSPRRAMRLVVLPPAFRRIWPALASQIVLLMLASSITSQISVEELTGIAGRVQSETFRSFEVYAVVGGLYLVMAFTLRGALALLGRALFRWPAT